MMIEPQPPSTAPHTASASEPLRIVVSGPVAEFELARPDKRNALSDQLIAALHTGFATLPREVRVVILHGRGSHFCAGLDLNELSERDAPAGILHSRSWHAAFAHIEGCGVPVIAVLQGAVIGGGLELASCAHLRVAEDGTFFALPEGQRGLFMGGGGALRIPRLIGVARMTDMMLTGRTLDADEGERLGLVNYRVARGAGLAKAHELAARIAANAPLTNFAITQALPRIARQNPDDGLFAESLMAAIAQEQPEAKVRMRQFLDKKAGKVQP